MKGSLKILAAVFMCSTVASAGENDLSKKALAALIENSKNVQLTGDVSEGETLAQVLAQALVSETNTAKVIKNHCTSEGQKLACELDMAKMNVQAGGISEATVSYSAVRAGTEVSKVGNTAEVTRGAN